MKKTTILLFFVFTCLALNGQNKHTKNADKLFSSFEYALASKEYLSLIENGMSDPYIYKQLGSCYFNNGNSVEAEKWYSKAMKSKQDAETYFNYAQILKSNSKYSESDSQMKVFVTMSPNDERAKEFNKNLDYLTKLRKIEKRFVVNKIALNSEKSDFGAFFHSNILYFASARNENNKIYARTNEPFLDLYQSNYNDVDGTYSDPKAISELNSVYHEGPMTITKDGNTAYFSSESFNSKSYLTDKVWKLKLGQINLYRATKVNEKWGSIISLPFNGDQYSTGNPSINREGTLLYFSSNRPGSIGGSDIWKVAVNSDGSYGIPENLGDKVNTVGDENFPFTTDDNILYFSSNGWIGFGGLDIYYVDLNTNEGPSNMGSPVNTEKDDFAFTFNEEKNIGYMSSNRLGVDDIYTTIPVCKSEMVTIVKNAKTGEILEKSKVVFKDENENILSTKLTDENGEVVYNSDCQVSYAIDIYKDGFVTKSVALTKIKSGKQNIEVLVDPIGVVVTDTEIILNPIYFEANKSNITSQAAIELDKLAYVMSQNAKLAVLIKSHTDSRGSNMINLEISQQRANATLQYLVSKGISSEKLSAKGFGKSDPKVDCKENCTEEENALNRRSEFMIVKQE